MRPVPLSGRLAALAALFLALLLTVAFHAPPARAEDQVWIRIEALPSPGEARARALDYAGSFANLQGYRVGARWYALVLGPYGVAEGASALARLRADGRIPSDSYISDGGDFGSRFWPEGAEESAGATPAAPEDAAGNAAQGAGVAVAPEAAPPPAAEAPAAEEPAAGAPDETLREARAGEAALSADERRQLQSALAWFGFYAGGIDGAFGPGTRNAMAAWQEALGLEPTGVLTSRQRATLVANHEAEVAEYGFAPVEEQEAGIGITLPLALVEFDRYDPPFVLYRARNGSGLSIALISEPGDQGTFDGLYDLLQTLDAMPATGERQKGRDEFAIHGVSASHDSRAWAGLKGGLVKGWMLLSTPANAERDARVAEVMAQGFHWLGETALDPGMVPLDEAARRGLVAGLEVRRPKSSRSGFYVSDRGDVLTTSAAVAGCGHITLDRTTAARVTLDDAASGLAVLAPEQALAPPAVAAFAAASPRLGAEVAVAGYSWGERLPSPVLTWGAFEEARGLNGEEGLARLSLEALPGDAGGPVVDATGAVLGMLLPPSAGGTRVLPGNVAFAAGADMVAAVLERAGLRAGTASGTAALPPETLLRRATGMTVLVSCWD